MRRAGGCTNRHSLDSEADESHRFAFWASGGLSKVMRAGGVWPPT